MDWLKFNFDENLARIIILNSRKWNENLNFCNDRLMLIRGFYIMGDLSILNAILVFQQFYGI